MTYSHVSKRLKENWKSGVTVALISVPLSIALSVASGAGPLPGVITGIWATLIAAWFGGSNYNIIGAAGALSSILFLATVQAPNDIGAAVLPLLAILSGLLIFITWSLRIDRFLYYIPSSIIYGFAAGVAILIAASQLFDATGLSQLSRTGHLLGDVSLYIENIHNTHLPSLAVFLFFLALIFTYKRFVKVLPAVIPVSLIGIVFGYVETRFINGIDITSLGDKFGTITARLYESVPWHQYADILTNTSSLQWLLSVAGTIALISILETLITAQLADKITNTQFSSRRELFGLGLANLGSGILGGLPATGVFIRTGANIKAGATHKTSAMVAAVCTAFIALLVMPFFTYIPMPVIAALLVNTALGLLETHKFVEFYQREKRSFAVALLVVIVTIFEDAGVAVLTGAGLALLLFADQVSTGYFDIYYNFSDGTKKEVRQARVLDIPTAPKLSFITYSMAGALTYIDSTKHAHNLRLLAHSAACDTVIIRLRNLFSIDFEGEETIVAAIETLRTQGKQVYVTSANIAILERLTKFTILKQLHADGYITTKSEDAIKHLTTHAT